MTRPRTKPKALLSVYVWWPGNSENKLCYTEIVYLRLDTHKDKSLLLTRG